MTTAIFISIWISTTSVIYISCQSFQTVSTRSGPIKGVMVPTAGGNVVQFRNIPFAKPPVGELRFRKPEPVEPWTDTLDCTRFGPSCIQNLKMLEVFSKLMDNQEISEDCLQLNVFVPGSVSPNAKKAVMVWFHGGAFLFGSSTVYDGSFLALKDIIVVTANYRVGALGFLSTGDSSLPGNYGLWDQIEALTWVHDNIEFFGGDSNRVTIFGQSAGAHTVSLLALIPKCEGLFQRIICQSGNANVFSSLSQNPMKVALRVAKNLGCISEDDSQSVTSATVDCLRQKTADKLLEAQGNNMEIYQRKEFSLLPEMWPVIDNDLIIRHPTDSLKNPNSLESVFFKSLDVLIGTTDNEGAFAHLTFAPYQEAMKFSTADGIPSSILCQILAPAIAKEVFDDDAIVSELICAEYSAEDLAEQGKQICNLLSDIFFVFPTVELLEYHVAGENIKNAYHYVYAQPLSFAAFMPMPNWVEGAEHGADGFYLFGPKYINTINESFSSDEGKTFTDIFVSYWTNFAKSGNPNGRHLVHWDAYSTKEKDFLELKYKPVQKKSLFENRVKFLRKLHEIVHERRKDVKVEL